MSKILIAHIPNTLNYGSAMMAINLIVGLRSRLGLNAQIFCDCDDFHLQRLREATNDLNLTNYLPLSNSSSRAIKLWQLLRARLPFVQDVADRFDAMVVLGGDDMSETYTRAAILRGMQYRQINRKCKVILAGQSLGPFKGVYKLISKWVFDGLTVITRDDNSYEFCKNIIKIPDVIQSRDLAIYALPFQEKWNRIRKILDFKDNTYIVVVPSGLSFEYTTDLKGYEDTWHELINRLLNRDGVDRIVLLAHVLSPKRSSDVQIIEALISRLPVEVKERIVICKNPMQPAEARAILGGAKYVVTGRMHAAVSTFFERKPALSLAYSEKYMGVIGKGFGLYELIIDCRDRKWGQSSEILNEVDLALDNLEEQYDDICAKINLTIKECSRKVELQLDHIAQQIRHVG